MTLFWPLDGWKCHNAFVWCIYYTAYICACANGAWVFLCAYIRFIWKLVWMWMKLHLVEKWPTNVSSHTKHYLAFVSVCVEECWFPQFLSHILDPLMVRGSNIIFQLGSHAHLSSFVCLCKTIMDKHTSCLEWIFVNTSTRWNSLGHRKGLTKSCPNNSHHFGRLWFNNSLAISHHTFHVYMLCVWKSKENLGKWAQSLQSCTHLYQIEPHMFQLFPFIHSFHSIFFQIKTN